MFMFGCAEGKTRPIPMLYDSGCSDLLLKEGIPGKELEGVKVANGPFVIGAVGDMKVMARDAWMVKCKMMDGGCQVLEGLTVDKVTSKFPRVNLDAAVKAVKSSQPGNKLLQNVKIPSEVGGEVEILIGIKYNALFPTLIHMLPNGLALYHLRVKSFNSHYTAVIAGPYSSFDRLLDKVGNTDYLLQKFQEGLQNWRSLGPPKIKHIMCPPMSREDESMALHLNIMEHGGYVNIPDDGVDVDNDDDYVPVCLSHKSLESTEHESQSSDLPAVLVNPVLPFLPVELVNFDTQSLSPSKPELVNEIQTQALEVQTDGDEIQTDPNTIQTQGLDTQAEIGDIQTQECSEDCKFVVCVDCGCELMLSKDDAAATLSELTKAHTSTDDEDSGRLSVSQMKKIVEAQDKGLQIEYRCPKCRQ